MISLLQPFADNAVLIILAVALFHFFGFVILLVWKKIRLTKLVVFLRGLRPNRGVPDEGHGDIYFTIESVMNYIRDALNNKGSKERRELLERIQTRDERPPLQTTKFEQFYSVAKTGVEVYPLLGILGTVVAMAVSIQPNESLSSDRQAPVNSAVATDQAGTADAQPETVASDIVENFGSAIVSTLVGLFFGIVFMLGSAWTTPPFERAIEVHMEARELLARGKRELMSSTEQDESEPEPGEEIDPAADAGDSS